MKLFILLTVIKLLTIVYAKSLSNDNGIFEVTYPGIGHFTLLDFWDPLHRPVVLLPQSPDHIATKFLLYTRQNQDSPQTIKQGDQQAIKSSHFDGKKQTKFIIHGFFDNQIVGQWMRDLKTEFLKSSDCNVFLVDWSGGNGMPYVQATANTKVVGPVLALFIEDIKAAVDINLNDVQILGHSLGAHIAGYAGQRLNGKVGRITGMDPAGPYYEGLANKDAKLDSTDALFVDAIHSDGRHLETLPDVGFGMMETSGHLDFYPNGGHNQPGCENEKWTTIATDGLFEGVRRFSSCNHQRAVDFYKATINAAPTTGIGHQCTDFDAFKAGKCVDCGSDGVKCAQIGVNAVISEKYEKQTVGTKYFLKTTNKYHVMYNLNNLF
ncbi:pancreatic triacylglycerol lipase-like [Oppia nitens]|uniref:pancreatic triacylglycerol lipase-like n=1 Tax=Oppia nitens TaxID=1686743 RepID=UPI0023DBA908|nr:pancreatic triacylglycerol lipase-like [Oppia nitens]